MTESMSDFEQERHKPPTTLERPRELVIACVPLRSNVNLSRIVRAAGCCGVQRVICCGHARVIDKIARDSIDADLPTNVSIEVHRTLEPQIAKLRSEGFRLVGLEQTTGSHCIYEFAFPRKMALVIGNERGGLDPEVLKLLDDVVEIPVYGRPLAHNVATATAMAMYEYCRQYPRG